VRRTKQRAGRMTYGFGGAVLAGALSTAWGMLGALI